MDQLDRRIGEDHEHGEQAGVHPQPTPPESPSHAQCGTTRHPPGLREDEECQRGDEDGREIDRHEGQRCQRGIIGILAEQAELDEGGDAAHYQLEPVDRCDDDDRQDHRDPPPQRQVGAERTCSDDCRGGIRGSVEGRFRCGGHGGPPESGVRRTRRSRPG